MSSQPPSDHDSDPLASQQASEPPSGAEESADALESRAIPPFDWRAMERRIVLDRFGYWGGIAVTVVVAGFVLNWTHRAPLNLEALIPFLLMAMLVAAWLGLNMISVSVSRQLGAVSRHISAEPAEAETALAALMRRWPLVTWVRLMLYHRLAVLRYRQRRFAEAAAICQAVLNHRLGAAGHMYPSILLLLAGSGVEAKQLQPAYDALLRLHQLPLSLTQALQRLALQTRYELLAGYDANVLEQGALKVQYAELMPAPQSGAMHAMLATAAERTDRHELADWLWRRAELLSEPGVYEKLRQGQFNVQLIDEQQQQQQDELAGDEPAL